MLRLEFTNRPASDASLKKTRTALEKFMNRSEIGFKDLTNRESLWSEGARLGHSLRERATDLILIGIGGSSLGPQLLADLATSSIRVHFADNVDPWLFRKTLRSIQDWNRCHVLLISKSGSTLESLVMADLLSPEFAARGIDFAARTTVITEPRDNSLRQWALAKGSEVLDVPLDVGGRFSILSPVGLVLAETLGLSLPDLREGARLALRDQDAIVRLSAEALESFDRSEWITLIWSYSSGLRYFGLWFQQLWAESLGKEKDRRGQPAPRVSTPLSAVGACDQHSLLQQLMDGDKDKWVLQLRVRACEQQGPLFQKSQFSALSWLKPGPLGQVLAAEAMATARALESRQVSVRTMELEDLGPKSIGYLLMFWQLVVACVGESLEIDAFDQPGVELGKRLAKEILQN